MCWEWRAASQEPGALTAVGLTRGPGPPVCRLRCRCDQGFRPLHGSLAAGVLSACHGRNGRHHHYVVKNTSRAKRRLQPPATKPGRAPGPRGALPLEFQVPPAPGVGCDLQLAAHPVAEAGVCHSWKCPQSEKQPREGRRSGDPVLHQAAGRQLARGRCRGRGGAFLPAAGPVRVQRPVPGGCWGRVTSEMEVRGRGGRAASWGQYRCCASAEDADPDTAPIPGPRVPGTWPPSGR